ncbi:hypothetical protein PVL29_005789 [Vitis rotundifolia]|uniref:Classical arabinogalactan protein 26-like n=1 Tax=Vitis rotundifolia TaxID=103349 RepID=A0AA39A3E4_VITRO|nr:hypothetical protein PVL29_005789 [Vitis rotundifolia]
MASFWLLLVLIMPFMLSPLLSLSPEQLHLQTPTISTSPAVLLSPALSPLPPLSPDISPLFPSPGGVLPVPTGSSMPTIPSNPSPPNPDDVVALGPGFAISPSASLPATSLGSLNAVESLNLVVFLGLHAFWLL